MIFGDEIDRSVFMALSPLNGTGLQPVLRTLKETGSTGSITVTEQEHLDGCFLTCPYPNPDINGAMLRGMEFAARNIADLLLATDPDCDPLVLW